MDCEACNNLLLDHLYGEIDEVRSAAVRKHLDGCADCAAAFERLAGGRRVGRLLQPIDAPLPNAALHEAIHAAAIANARPRAEGASESVAPVIPIGAVSRIPRWMSRVGEMAMRRQVAMAAVFLLMVGFGLGYHQFQSPTRPVQLTDEPGAEVIPATELPQTPPRVTSEGEGAARAHHGARSISAEPHTDRRETANARTATTSTIGRVAELSQPPAPTSPLDETARQVNAPTAAAQYQAAIPPSNTRESPAAYRNLPTSAQAPVGSAALGQRVTGDPALDQALPRLALDGTAQANTWNAQVAQQRAGQTQNSAGVGSSAGATWRALRDNGENLRARGQSDLAIVAFRDALAQDPPDSDRRAIAQSLYETLLQSGQVREAAVVQGRYLARPSEVNSLANEVHTDSQPSIVTSRPAASRPMPSHLAPRARRAAPQADSYNNLAY